MCRWCSIGEPGEEKTQFEIHHHIHCNRSGKKDCSAISYPYSLQLPVARREIAECSVNELPSSAPAFTVKTKMSQSQKKKAAAKAAKENSGLSI